MPSDASAAAINSLAIREMLDLPKLYGPNGYLSGPRNGAAAGPPAGLVAALGQLETATVDPSLLTGDQSVASVEAQTAADLAKLSGIIGGLLYAASHPEDRLGNQQVSLLYIAPYPMVSAAVAADAQLFTPGAATPPVTVADPPPPPASGVEQYLVTNLTAGVSDWEDGQGAAGSTGLTLHVAAPGKPIISLTLAGYAKADLSNGHLGVTFGNDPASGSDHLLIQGT